MLSSSKPKPVSNLYNAIVAILTHTGDLVGAMDVIYSQLKKDKHGNIILGLDNPEFSLWRNKLERIMPRQFGPVFIMTNPLVIGAILAELKSGADAHFAGNRSTEMVGDLVQNENIFAAANSKVHTFHKGQFKNFLSDQEANIEKIAPIVKSWIHAHGGLGGAINDKKIQHLSAEIMLRFLLSEESAGNEEFLSAIVDLKSHFVKKTTLKEMSFMQLWNGYKDAKETLSFEIYRLTRAAGDSYPKVLAAQGLELKAILSHVLSLMMVGFDNLQSSLVSLLYCLSEHPEYHARLRNEMVRINGVDVLRFDLATFTAAGPNTFSQQFIMESLRLTPPVWMQARENKEERVIKYRDEAKGEQSFTLPSRSKIIIPNFQIARELEDGHEFIPERSLGEGRLFNPFSVGLNACPGRNIAYAAAGVLVAEILTHENDFVLTRQPQLDPQVSLKLKGLEIEPRESKRSSAAHLRAREHEERSDIYKMSGQLAAVVTLGVFLHTHDVIKAGSAGLLVGMLAMFYLFHHAQTQANHPARLFSQAVMRARDDKHEMKNGEMKLSGPSSHLGLH